LTTATDTNPSLFQGALTVRSLVTLIKLGVCEYALRLSCCTHSPRFAKKRLAPHKRLLSVFPGSADHFAGGGTIQIHSGGEFTSIQSKISATGGQFYPNSKGGTIHVDAERLG